MKSLGQVAYEKFLQLESNNPSWLLLTFAQKRHWEIIADTVVNEFSARK